MDLGFPACPFNLHEECACIYGGRGWAADPRQTGVQMYFINCNELYERLTKIIKQKVMFYKNKDFCVPFKTTLSKEFTKYKLYLVDLK